MLGLILLNFFIKASFLEMTPKEIPKKKEKNCILLQTEKLEYVILDLRQNPDISRGVFCSSRTVIAFASRPIH